MLVSRSGTDGTPPDAAASPAIPDLIYVERDASVVDLEGTTLETVPGLPDDARSLSLSPDRHRIVFMTTRRGPLQAQVIATIVTDGSGLRRLPATEGISASSPSLSPDGTVIAFQGEPSASAPNPSSEIYVMGADGSDARKITSGPGDGEAPQWSPDGSSIVYFRRSQRAAGVWTVSLQTGSSSRLTVEEARGPALSYSYDLAYSPDGSRIAYSREGEIGVMGSDGTAPHPILVGDEPAFAPRWSPDGTMLAYTTLAPSDLPFFRGGPLLQVNVVEIATGEHHAVGDAMVSGGSAPVWWSNDELLVRAVVGV